MRIVVTGATGFLGGHLCRHLHHLGHEVIGLGRDAAKGAALKIDGIGFHALDLSQPGPGLSLPPVDAFIHAAALSSNWGPRKAFQAANVTGTQNALALSDRLGADRFVFISSPSVYFRFRDQLDQNENDPLPPPVNAYAESKQQAEALVRAHPNAVIIRPRGLYGRGDTTLLPRLVRAAKDGALPLLRHGDAVTDLTHVDDVVGGITCALMSRATGTYNISGGAPQTIKSIIEQTCGHAGITPRFTGIPVGLALFAARTAELLARLTPGQPEPIFTTYSVGVMAYSQTLDLTAARRGLGYAPQIDFANGLRRTFA
nr:NAD(P)-dependent oxidoreductase [Asticcacaulis sp. AC460]